jgi:phosphoribosylformylglycinamidine synthase subunit PurL
MSHSARRSPATAATLAAEHGLSTEEYALLLSIMGREPTLTEVGIFSVMWSEHCSYKSSKRWLKTLPTTAPWVICGPGENAGVIDIGDGQAAIFKIESHNHPSYIEPYQGAATGVGGIMRDVFTMGARPIANLNALRFGDPGHPKTRHLLAGVVAGIGGYGNCMGVPTVGGECEFHPAYNGNCLVNAMTVGLADADKIFYSAAAGVDNLIVYVGSKTGRDGIHGATMASAEFSDDSAEKRPTVQVGDPFTEKLLLEACLELMATDAIVAIQDMGAAGLTSSSVEMASKGKLGVELNLDAVPMRENGMTAYEIMLSESQERMLMVLRPEREAMAQAIFQKWDLDFAVIGWVTDTGHLVVKRHGVAEANIPVAPLVSNAPEYDRPREETPPAPVYDSAAAHFPRPLEVIWLELLAHPGQASKRWIWEQYDSSVMGDTLRASGGDAALVRIHGTQKALAMTTDCTPRYCQANPFEGGKQAVAESWRNLVATGARPLAITNNLNFGNPEKPRIMGQIAGAVQGMGEACRALDYPVISGNVSLYNETNGQAILPTPVVGGVGLLADVQQALPNSFAAPGETVLLVGAIPGWLGCSLYLQVIEEREFDTPPPVDLALERRHGEFVLAAHAAGLLTACHDVSSGGLLLALTDMALGGNVGVSVEIPLTPAALFGEDQGRYVITTRDVAQVMQRAAEHGVAVMVLGETGGEAVSLKDGPSVDIGVLRQTCERWLPAYMES